MAYSWNYIAKYSTIDYASNRVILVSQKRTLIGLDSYIIHEGDQNSHYIEFETNRFEDTVDLGSSDLNLRIYFLGKRKSDGLTIGTDSPAYNVRVTGEFQDSKIRFGCIIPSIYAASVISIRLFAENVSSSNSIYFLTIAQGDMEILPIIQ